MGKWDDKIGCVEEEEEDEKEREEGGKGGHKGERK